jgi:hypothetical protein
MYREVMESEGITPAAPGQLEGTGEPDWTPNREGEPNSWYEKVGQPLLNILTLIRGLTNIAVALQPVTTDAEGRYR